MIKKTKKNVLFLLGTKGGPAIRPNGSMPSSSLLILDKKKILVDAGLGVSKSLTEINFNLNELSNRGFLKKVIVKNDKMWFDTNLSKHHHFYDEEEDRLVDIQEKEINFSKFPKAPHGKNIKSVDIIINIKKD